MSLFLWEVALLFVGAAFFIYGEVQFVDLLKSSQIVENLLNELSR